MIALILALALVTVGRDREEKQNPIAAGQQGKSNEGASNPNNTAPPA